MYRLKIVDVGSQNQTLLTARQTSSLLNIMVLSGCSQSKAHVLHRQNLLCRYHYDPLDRLANCTLSVQARTQRFYPKERLTSEIQG